MAGFTMLATLSPFEGVELESDYRFSGTVYANGDHSFDEVEVPGRGQGLSRDGWRTINRLHPLYMAASRYLDTEAATESARAAIRNALDGDHQEPDDKPSHRAPAVEGMDA